MRENSDTIPRGEKLSSLLRYTHCKKKKKKVALTNLGYLSCSLIHYQAMCIQSVTDMASNFRQHTALYNCYGHHACRSSMNFMELSRFLCDSCPFPFAIYRFVTQMQLHFQCCSSYVAIPVTITRGICLPLCLKLETSSGQLICL